MITKVNSLNYNNYNSLKRTNFNSQPNFTGFQSAWKSIQTKTNKIDNEFTDGIINYLLKPVFDNKLTLRLAEKMKDVNNIYKHILTIGSAITSGMYMARTLQNKDLDKDRKNTLAINQALTFAVSTAGSYALDSAISNWWENKMVKYAANKLKEPELINEFVDKNNKIKLANKGLKHKDKTDLLTAKNFIKEKAAKLLSTDDFNTLNNRINGMSLLKTMVVFALVYRYLVPVAVTPFANKIGEKSIEMKKAKALAKENQETQKS